MQKNWEMVLFSRKTFKTAVNKTFSFYNLHCKICFYYLHSYITIATYQLYFFFYQRVTIYEGQNLPEDND